MANIDKFKMHLRNVLAAVLITVMTSQFTGCAQAADLAGRVSGKVSSSSLSVSESAVVPGNIQQTASAGNSAKKTKSLNEAVSSKADVKAIKIVRDESLSQGTQEKVTAQSASPAAGYKFIPQKSGYNSLPSSLQRTFYSMINNSVYNISDSKADNGYYPTGSIYVIGKLSEDQIIAAIKAYFNDNPQVFWITNSYAYAYKGNSTYFRMFSYIPSSQCSSAIDTFNSKIQAAVKAMPTGLDEFNREEYLFNYLVNNCSYDDAAVTDSSRWQSFTAYGAIVEGKAVCEGYSRAMQLLSSDSGLKCMVVEGTSNNVRHMWNAINIGGDWYYLDVTWCDGSFVVHNYFNITESVLKKTHTIAPLFSSLTASQIDSGSQFNLTLPQCNSTKENYFNVKGIKVYGLSGTGDTGIINTIANGLKSGKTAFPFLIDSKANYTSTVNGLLRSSPYKMSTYFYSALKTSGLGSNIKKLSYVEDKDDRGLNVEVALG